MKIQNNIYSQQTRQRLALQNNSNKERRTAELLRLVDQALRALEANTTTRAYSTSNTPTINT